MQKKYVTISVFAVMAIILGLFLFFGGKTSAPSSTLGIGSPSPNTESASATVKEFTTTEVALHNSKTDCWTIISGNVYDLTSYIPRHEGGDEILRACGVDGTTLFTQRETSTGETVGSGTPHDNGAQAQLSSLKIGIVAQ